MVTWEFKESVETEATADQVWAMWCSPTSWPLWDDGIEWVSLQGSFTKGARGVMKPVGGPKVKFELLDVYPNQGFKDRSFLPLTTLDFIHTYTPASTMSKARITHHVEMRGWLTPIFKRVIGSNIRKGLPGALRKLAAIAEKAE